jgi:hypothetical protein
MGRSPASHPAAESYGTSRNVTITVAAAVAIIVLGAGSLVLQLTAQHQGAATPHNVQQQLLSIRNDSAQLSKLTNVIEQLQQQVAALESHSMDRMHTAVTSTRDTVSEVKDAVQRMFAHASSTGTKLDTLLSKAGAAGGADQAATAGQSSAAAPCPSPSPAPRVKRLVVSMSSFPGRAEFAIPTVYSIM